MFRNLTFNSYIWILLGVGCIIAGSYFGWQYRRGIMRMFPLPFGLVLSGISMTISGLTNGFTDHTLLGRQLTKLATLTAIPGIPLLAYGIWTSI